MIKVLDELKSRKEQSDSIEINIAIDMEKIKKEKEEYIDNVLIKNVHVGKGLLGDLGLFGEIKNNGNKTLSEVVIKVYCLDKSGMYCYEKTFIPVRCEKYSFLNGDPLYDGYLKPNYSKKFGYKMDDVPSDWNRKVDVKVTNIEFLDVELDETKK